MLTLNDTPICNNPAVAIAPDVDENTPRIYVACLASYNCGILHGVWLDATQEVDIILKEISLMLSKSRIPGAEESAIHDYEGFCSLEISEYEAIEDVHQKALFVLAHGELGAKLATYYGGNLDDAEEALAEHYHGEHKTELDYAMDLFDELYLDAIPEPARYYVDYDMFQRDIFINDYFSIEVGGKCHVFNHH